MYNFLFIMSWHLLPFLYIYNAHLIKYKFYPYYILELWAF
jgi:hypothetical protein